jgi:hypothetical protein
VSLFENQLPNFAAFQAECSNPSCCSLSGNPNWEKINHIRNLARADRRLRPDVVAVTEKILTYFGEEKFPNNGLARWSAGLATIIGFIIILIFGIAVGAVFVEGGVVIVFTLLPADLVAAGWWIWTLKLWCDQVRRKNEIDRDLARLTGTGTP